MGRYDFRPVHVYKTASHQLRTKQIPTQPPWYKVVAEIPPSQPLIRTQPVQHKGRRSKSRRPSRMFQPQPITYPEDELRRQFFSDHPWELARPRVLLEDDGKDYQSLNWSRLEQPGRQTSGESVVQRQLWLLDNDEEIVNSSENRKSKTQMAYDKARKEFYAVRHRQEIQLRIAKEEALASGAYFEKGPLEVGMELENKTWDTWREWAGQQADTLQQQRAGAYTGLPQPEEAEESALEKESRGAEDEPSEEANTAFPSLGRLETS